MAKVGRPKSDNPRSFTIPEVRVTREEYRMVKLKADLYSNGSTAGLIREAVKRYAGSIPEQTCHKCSKIMEIESSTEEYEFDVSGQIHSVKVKNVPTYSCRACRVKLGDLRLYADLEEAVEDEIFHRLNARKSLPDEIDFYDFIQANKANE